MNGRRALARKATQVSRWFDATVPVRTLPRRMEAMVARRLVSPDFWYGRYPHTFLERLPPVDTEPSTVPDAMWCFWVGDNPLTPVRQRSLDSIRALNPSLSVELITPDRLPDFVVDEHPLHPAYPALSFNHRSDYLRAYFLHHYGGGYADIKPLLHPWAPALARLRTSDAWVIGPGLGHAAWAGNPGGRLEQHLRRYHASLPSGTCVAARSHTPVTGEWLREIERRLDYYAPALAECPGDMWGQEAAYPIEWMALQGNIFQPLCLKHRQRVLLDDALAWDASAEYR